MRHQPSLTHRRRGSRERPWWCYLYHTCSIKGSRGGSRMGGSSAFSVRKQVSNEHRQNWYGWDICHHVPSISLLWSLREIILFWKMVDILQPPLSFSTKNEAVRSPSGFYLYACNCKHWVLLFQTYKKGSDSEVKD